MTDIVGSTEHASELGDGAWRELIQLHHSLVRKSLNAHGGREVDTAGDGFFAVFDAPADAVTCALEIAERIADLGVEVRAGAHTGEVEQIGSKVGGITVPIASRIMAEAAPSEILVSSTVRDLAAGSGLVFEDRGSRTLKGVTGEWHIFAATRPEANAATQSSAADLGDRRAAAVSRSRARPVWRRRPRVAAAAIVALAVILATTGLLVWQPWLRPALGAIKDNSVGQIDIGRNVITASIEVGQRPGGTVISDGALWVTNTGSATVSQISLDAQTVTRIIDVGPNPVGIAATEGSVWVANSGRRSVSQISTSTSRVVNEIPVGNGPTAVASGAGYVWVANSGDSTVSRIDPNTATVDMRIPVAARPIAVAVGDVGVWIASADGATVTHLDPHTGVTLAAPIPLGGLPVGVALGSGSVWVATTDGRVTRINPDQNRIATIVDTGGSLSSIVADDSAVWVADRDGWVVRLDAADPSTAPTRIGISSSPEALALSEGSVWVATRASPSSHRGGTLHVLYSHLPVLDPLGFPDFNAASLEGDGLVGYRHVGGVAGATLLPDLATSLPHATNGGLTYSFQLRPDLVYSTGEPVLAADFRRAIERAFQVNPDPDPSIAPQYLAIAGAQACLDSSGEPSFGVPCDLSQGVLTDEGSRTVTFNLVEPDPDLLYKLALPAAYPVAATVPMDGLVEGAFTGTGPYTVSSATENEVRFTRNPNFRVWDPDVRPDGFPDEIVWTSGIEPDEQIAMVERSDADWMPFRGDNRISPEAFANVRGRYAAQLQFGAKGTTAAWMNTALSPFDKLEVRQALNLAVDRARVADLYGGPLAAAVTCQYLPPGWLGYEPYCPYTTHPDPGGRWQAPDLDAARQLVDASGTKGAHVVVGPVRARHAALRDYIVSVLQELGFDAVADPRTDDDAVFGGVGAGTTQIGVFEFFSATQAPSEFLSGYTCFLADGLSNYCDETYDELFNHARDFQTTDMAAAASAWAEADRATVDRAIFVPLVNEGSDFLSERVGNYQFNPGLGVLLDQLWVQ